MNQLAVNGINKGDLAIPSKVFFSVEEGSNYKILMTYDREEVIEFEQFQKLARVIFDSEVLFVTINQRIVNKSTIIDISPTKERTTKQKAERERKEAEKRKIESRMYEIAEIRNDFIRDYWNRVYGINRWKVYANPLNRERDLDIHIITNDEHIEVNEAYQKQYPELLKEAEELSNMLKNLQ